MGLPLPMAAIPAALGAILVTLAALSAPIGAWSRLALIPCGVAAALSFLRHWREHGPPADLVITRTGKVRYREGAGLVWTGQLGTAHWHSRRVALVRVRMPFGALCCLVLRGRQRDGEYRRLRVWLRHGIPEGVAPGSRGSVYPR